MTNVLSRGYEYSGDPILDAVRFRSSALAPRYGLPLPGHRHRKEVDALHAYWDSGLSEEEVVMSAASVIDTYANRLKRRPAISGAAKLVSAIGSGLLAYRYGPEFLQIVADSEDLSVDPMKLGILTGTLAGVGYEVLVSQPLEEAKQPSLDVALREFNYRVNGAEALPNHDNRGVQSAFAQQINQALGYGPEDIPSLEEILGPQAPSLVSTTNV